MRAAVLEEVGKPLSVTDVELLPPRRGEVRIGIRATGVCHSDMSVRDGSLPWPLPAVLGHEGAGEVLELGEDVQTLAVGDRVVVSWVPTCGHCFFCVRGQANLCHTYRGMLGRMDDGSTRLRRNGIELSHGINAATFAEEAVLRTASLVRIDADVPYEIGALIGCGVLTGVGAAMNTARIEAGERVAIIGAGGVGLNVVQGCKIAGASVILAIDPVESKRQAALAFGATHACAPEEADALCKELTGGIRPDAVFEVVGRAALQRVAFDMVRPGGRAVMVGAAPHTDAVSFPAMGFLFLEKRVLGCYYGSCDPRRDVGRIVDLWRAGRLDLDRLITGRAPLDGVNDAFAAIEAGTAIRTLLIP